MEQLPISADHLEKIKKWLGSGAINIYGPPFAGKDTHGHELSHLLNAPLLSSGQVFRDSKHLMTPEDIEILDTGGLPPSDVFFELFTPYLSRAEYDEKPLILSSVGRMPGEVQGVVDAANASGHPIKAVFYLKLDDDKVYERRAISEQLGDRGGRPEDAEHRLATRLHFFETQTLTAIDDYRQRGLLIEINSDAAKDEVLRSILSRLFLLASTED